MPTQVIAELEKVFNAPLIESYGMTEASPGVSSMPIRYSREKLGASGVPVTDKNPASLWMSKS